MQEKFVSLFFLQDFDQILQENYLAIFLAILLQNFLYLARKASYLQEKLHTCKIRARFSARYYKSYKKILSRFAYFLQDGFY